MSVTLTEAAASEIKRVMSEQNRPELKFVRVGVAGGGCSGFQYSFDFTNSFDESADVMLEHHGVGVVVDKKSDLFLDGTEIDFYTGLEKRGFTFKNPNAVKSCGCGSSFSA
ncbi:MAG: iron-sulfur cluster assembly accessory protein [Planctomycetota bacterium]|nr:iron-sulfur cluster assembly accessory protein [Planctomycetales bacterium]RLT09876.1 MAG: iron-sulfur cluster assembly accessory protein [Planctomycetota bacterium]